jgi:hypothetical protein
VMTFEPYQEEVHVPVWDDDEDLNVRSVIDAFYDEADEMRAAVKTGDRFFVWRIELLALDEGWTLHEIA